MDNISKYKKSFIDALSIKEDIVNSKLEYNSIPEWDSIGHMSLIGASLPIIKMPEKVAGNLSQINLEHPYISSTLVN